MKSPFPGMDPYIEARGLWKDFHDTLLADIKRTISPALPAGYVARTGTRSYTILVETEEKTERHFEPDVSVTGPRAGKPAQAGTEGSGATTVDVAAEAVSLRAFIEEDFEEKFIDIYELDPERRLVTSIEILSPSNKQRNSKGWNLYLRKRQALLLGRANLVEIDLLRGGTRMPMFDPLPSSPYYLLVAREEKAPRCRVWPAFFDRPLPSIPVPLRRPDPDIPLALQPLVEAIYERSRYAQDIDYSKPLDPPLSAEETARVQQLRAREVPAKKSSARPPRKRRR